MNIADKTILITGASRGIGRALIDEALRRGAQRVYAGTRGPLPHADPRVTAVRLDCCVAVLMMCSLSSLPLVRWEQTTSSTAWRGVTRSS